MSRRHTAPEIPTRILNAVLRGRYADTVLGDLEEEFLERAEATPLRARLTYWRDASSIVFRCLIEKRRRERRRRRHQNGSDHIMDQLLLNVRYALRRLLKAPFFTLVAILSMALGIGANTAVISLANAVLIRDMPFENAGELVDLYTETPGMAHSPSSFLDYLDLREGTTELFSEIGGANIALGQTEQDGRVVSLLGELVTGSYFPLLGVDAALGRTLLPEDDVMRGGHFVVMLGHAYWQSAYGGEPGVLGRSIRINGESYEIVGVAPEDYTGSIRGLRADFFASIQMINVITGPDSDQLAFRNLNVLFAKARLRPGVSLQRVEGTLASIADHLRRTYPTDWDDSRAFRAIPTGSVVVNPSIDPIIISGILLAAGVVGLVLLIACANLASFLLARATDQRREIAMRLALGASRGRLIRQLLTETMVLAFLGGVAGLALGTWLVGLLPDLELPFPVEIGLDLGLDWTVLGLTAGVTLLAGLFFGLLPALQATRLDLAPTLKDETPGGGGRRNRSLRSFLVVGQMAATIVLLVSASLFMRSLQSRRGTDPGFGHDPAAIVHFNLRGRTDAANGRLVLRRIAERVSALPSVRSVGLADNLPLNPLRRWTWDITVDGVDPPPGRTAHEIDQSIVDPGFFESMGIPIVEGRNFLPSDQPGGQRVAIINEVMAERFWPGENPIGRVFRREGRGEFVVVGVAQSTKVRTLGESPIPVIHIPYSQWFSSWTFLVARTSAPARDLLTGMAEIIRDEDPGAVLVSTQTIEEHLGAMLLPDRLGSIFLAAFAAVALILATIGLCGVVSYAVASRSQEMGIRMTLGAGPGRIVRIMLGGGMKLVVVGSVLGLVLAFLVSSALHGFLLGVAVLDPVAFVAVPGALLCVALLAAYVPARRAIRADPARTLRQE
jgi:predicted permease